MQGIRQTRILTNDNEKKRDALKYKWHQVSLVIVQRGKMKKLCTPRLRIQGTNRIRKYQFRKPTHMEDGQSWSNPIEWAVQDCLEFKKTIVTRTILS